MGITPDSVVFEDPRFPIENPDPWGSKDEKK